MTIGQVKIGRLQLQLGRAARHPGKQLRDASLAPGQILPAVGRPAEAPAVDVAARGNGRDLHDVIPRQIFADVIAEADLVELFVINDVDQIGLRLVEHIRAARHAGGLGACVVGNGRADARPAVEQLGRQTAAELGVGENLLKARRERQLKRAVGVHLYGVFLRAAGFAAPRPAACRNNAVAEGHLERLAGRSEHAERQHRQHHAQNQQHRNKSFAYMLHVSSSFVIIKRYFRTENRPSARGKGSLRCGSAPLGHARITRFRRKRANEFSLEHLPIINSKRRFVNTLLFMII